jgi:hypothetical protein
MFHPQYKEISMSGSEILSEEQPNMDCYYHGHIATESETSHAVVATCGGTVRAYFRGASTEHKLVTLEPVTRHLQTVEAAALEESHVVYLSGVTVLDKTCGVTHQTLEHHQQHQQSQNRQLLASGECDGQPTKYVEILIVNDHTHTALRPGGEAESFAAEAFALAAGYYAESAFDCNIQLLLVGQLSFYDVTAASISYRTCDTVDEWLQSGLDTSADCCDTIGLCADGDWLCLNDIAEGIDVNNAGCFTWDIVDSLSTGTKSRTTVDVTGISSSSGTEIDHQLLLRDFAAWGLEEAKDELETLFDVTIDNIALFTGQDFVGEVRGLATLSALCGTASASIEQVTESASYVGSLFAHELGHNFGMAHSDAGTIMESASSVFAPPTSFSATSQADLAYYLNDVFDSTCLDTAPATAEWDVPVCGNGRIDEGEECDNGFQDLYEDACCDSSTCLLNAGCVCGAADECCTDGQFSTDDQICRTALDEDCDIPEYCTGTSAHCPSVDITVQAGTSCGEDGLCYDGFCFEDGEVCDGNMDTSGQLVEAYCPIDPDRDNAIYECVVACATSNDPCPGTLAIFNSTQIADGARCWDGCQCVSGHCRQSSSIHFYTEADDGECYSEAGELVELAFCTDTPMADNCNVDYVDPLNVLNPAPVRAPMQPAVLTATIGAMAFVLQ